MDDDAEVGVETGLRAAEKLQSVLDKPDLGDEIAQIGFNFSQISSMRTTSSDLWHAPR